MGHSAVFAQKVRQVLKDWCAGLLTDREALDAISDAAEEEGFFPNELWEVKEVKEEA